MFNRKNSITKCRRILNKGFQFYKKKSTRLSSSQYREFESSLKQLDQAILTKDKQEADRLSKIVDSLIQAHFPKTLFDSIKEFGTALLFAIIVAFCVRQFWFELYEVPTGSMRPTILEQDRLFVSKTTFGINFPFTNKLWLYTPDRVKRGGTIVFTTEDMDIIDKETRYFYLFPGKKRFVKRCLAKGGDTLYFYGGRIYAIDKENRPIVELADTSWLEKHKLSGIDYVPIIGFDSKTTVSSPLKTHVYNEATILQMNQPTARIAFKKNEVEGRFFDGKEWKQEDINLLKQPHNKPVSYGDLWGINNYAMVRLLTPKEAQQFYPQQIAKNNGSAYLEIRHTPNVTFPSPILRQSESFILQPMLTPYKTILSLDEAHLRSLMDNMTTARFVVTNQKAYRYTEGKKHTQPVQFDPTLPKIPDGTYEFYKGKAYKIHLLGVRSELKNNHPLLSTYPSLIFTLFNMGINFNTLYQPTQSDQTFIPQRFAFYREGSLYVMDMPLFTKQEMAAFTENELAKQQLSSSSEPYIGFVDRGPPLKKNGEWDIDFIRAFGLKVPDGMLLALGDNYASSADSRDFGFVPEHNLRGAPLFTFWPPGKNIGPLPQTHYPWLTLPNFIIGTLVVVISFATIFYIRKRNNRSIFKEK